MTQLSNLSPTQVLLLATIFATESDFKRLAVLAADRGDVLSSTVILRILLTFCPSDIESYPELSAFLKHLVDAFRNVNRLDIDINISVVGNISETERQRRIQELRLERIQPRQFSEVDDEVAGFLVQWVYGLEATNGLNSRIHLIIDEFLPGRPLLHLWKDSVLIPLLRLQNDLYPGRADILDIRTVEHLQGEAGVRRLLCFAEQDGQDANIGRDLAEVVSPWVKGASSRKRRKIAGSLHHEDPKTSWESVNEWIFTTSCSDFDFAARAIVQWDGPVEEIMTDTGTAEQALMDSSQRYVQTIFATILNCPAGRPDRRFNVSTLLEKATSVMKSLVPHRSARPLLDANKADLLQNQLLAVDNPLTTPSEPTLSFLSTCVSVQPILESFKVAYSIATIADIILFGAEERQKQELERILTRISQLTSSDFSWIHHHRQILQLAGIQTPAHLPSDKLHLLARIDTQYLETQILDAMLCAHQYSAVKTVYLETKEVMIPHDQIKDRIVSAIYNMYDNASNGNRSRGGMKHAFDMLQTFQPFFPQEHAFSCINHLIKATHSLSFYQLTLQHGIPFQPVSIRVHHDPVSLIERVLEQNSKAYTKLDDLVDIGRNLIRSGAGGDHLLLAPETSVEERIFEAEHRITYLAINSALTDHDFDTAYSYITTRLSTTPFRAVSSPFIDDTSWRAAYAAGKYRPPASAKSIHHRIQSLSKRMDLLSLALTLSPTPEPLSEILATWRRAEEEMDSLRSQALEEERSVDKGSGLKSASVLPGGLEPEDEELDAAETMRVRERRALGAFGPTYEEEAPVGLFDMARGAASAFRKTAFPLGGAAAQQDDFKNKTKPGAVLHNVGADANTGGSVPARRKRDVVSGLVTGGLVSGMSWVLGAQAPTTDAGPHHTRHDSTGE